MTWTVNRTKPLPTGVNRCRLIVPQGVVAATSSALQVFHGPDGRHEGLVFWLGHRAGKTSYVLRAAVPRCEHEWARVMVAEDAVGELARAARPYGMAIVAQVHSHGGDDTRHSDGDDSLILMPFEGMFSVVVGHYGAGGMTLKSGLGLHEYQDRTWVRIESHCTDALHIVPSLAAVI